MANVTNQERMSALVILLTFTFGNFVSSVALASDFTSQAQHMSKPFQINSTNNVWVDKIGTDQLLSEPLGKLVILILVFIAATIVAILPILLTLRS